MHHSLRCFAGFAAVMSLLEACHSRGPVAVPSTSGGLDEAGRVPVEKVVEVHGPIAVGFFPFVTNEEASRDHEVGEAMAHFSFALQDLAECLKPSGIPVQAVYADSVVFLSGNKRDVLALRRNSSESVGCYFVAPGRQPKVVIGETGPSSLVVLCPAAASLYFSLPSCCPQGVRCCPDGRVIDKSYSCDG